MTPPPDRSVKIELNIRASQPELLEGLDALLRLGLISDAQVRLIARQSLCSPLPEPVQSAPPAPASEERPLPPEWLDETEAPRAKPRTQKSPGFLAQSVQSLMAELSVRWLLFLGVFMVVVSSGLLAASQWERIPAFAQYGVLLAYTLIFWGVSWWAALQPNLLLTAQTLQTVTLLLVPVNFWAMDAFRLWHNPLEWLTVAIASLALTAITALSFKIQPHTSRLTLFNILGLSYLHWGWEFRGFPLIAAYLATVGTAAIVFFQYRRRVPATEPDSNAQTSQKKHALISASLVACALGILLFRAIVIKGVPVEQLGLAVGICGWVFAWLSRKDNSIPLSSPTQHSALSTQHFSFPPSPTQHSALSTQHSAFPLWEQIGSILIVSGWVVSVGTQPAQALAVSGLGVWLFADRLQRFWQKFDLAAIYAIGLQMVWLIGRLIPPGVRANAIATGTELARAQNAPGTLLSLTWFPYLIFMLCVNDWLYRRDKSELAKFGDRLALFFGAFLTALGLLNPAMRSLNLIASTLTLAVLVKQRSRGKETLIYLTHVTGLLAITSTISWVFPTLNLGIWATLLLGLMLAEWLLFIAIRTSGIEPEQTTSPNPPIPALIWRESAWNLGSILAALSYVLLLINYAISFDNPALFRPQWGMVWAIAPISLVGVALASQPPRRAEAGWFSIDGAIAWQILTFFVPEIRLISLGIATAVTFVNVGYLQSLMGAAIAIGFALSFWFALLWEGIPGFAPLSPEGWVLVGAGTVAALWLLSAVLKRWEKRLADIYARSLDGWAIALCAVELSVLTLHSVSVYWESVNPSEIILLATAITMGAIAGRGWRQPNNWAVYSFGWSLEVLAAEALGFIGRSVLYLAIANIAIGLITQLIGDWWQRKSGRADIASSLHVMPLLYGGLGAALRWGTFANWTGLTTLGFALIGIGVGRRRDEFKPLVYLALIGVSLSAFEILWYRIESLAIGDELIAIAALATSFVYAYRLLAPWLKTYLHLSAEELKFAAHFHWAIGSFALGSAIAYPIKSADLVGLGAGFFLTRYAVMQGRRNPDPQAAEAWVYAGILEGVAIAAFIATKFKIVALLLPWAGAIAAVAAYFFYALPWEKWGWPKRPWTQTALILPVAASLYAADISNTASLLIAAAFYIFLAVLDRKIRYSYLSLFFINWALLRWFQDINLTDVLAYIAPPALSLLYIAQVDPGLKQAEQKEARHWLRVLGSSAICFVALVTHNWFVSGAVSLVAIFAGLALRVRAFLYIGTVAFLLNAINQLVILSQEYSFMKWIVGLLVGSAFIWIAASFETRREQIVSFVQNWLVEFQEWE